MKKLCATKGCKRTFIAMGYSGSRKKVCDACSIKKTGKKRT